jgi:hypothetical protein
MPGQVLLSDLEDEEDDGEADGHQDDERRRNCPDRSSSAIPSKTRR